MEGSAVALGDAEEDIEESEEFRRSQKVTMPTPAQIQQHEDENHAIYRNWCEVCVASRGLGQQHRRDKRELALKSQEGPKVCSDYFFMSTDEQSAPMIAAKFTRTGTIAATALEAKGLTGYGIRWFAGFLERLGLKKVIYFFQTTKAHLQP